MEKFTVICPCCEATLTLDAQTGAILASEEKTKILGSFEDLKTELDKKRETREQLFAQEQHNTGRHQRAGDDVTEADGLGKYQGCEHRADERRDREHSRFASGTEAPERERVEVHAEPIADGPQRERGEQGGQVREALSDGVDMGAVWKAHRPMSSGKTRPTCTQAGCAAAARAS